MAETEQRSHPRLRVAVVGGGMFFEEIIGQTLKDFMRGGVAPALNSVGMSHLAPEVATLGVDVVAVGTRRRERGRADEIARWFKQDFPDREIQPHYGDAVWDEILQTHQPDALLVATPDPLHTPPILRALDAGCDVITEKPLCLSVADADRIVEAAHRARRVVSVDLHKRYDPFVRDLLFRGRKDYGPLNRVRAVLEEPLEVSTEVFNWAAQSNPFAYVGCHWVDAVHHGLGVRPRALFATGQKKLLAHWDVHGPVIDERRGRDPSDLPPREKIETWDTLDVTVTYDNGMRADYNTHWINPAEFEAPVNQEIEVQGIYGRGMVDQQDRGYRETVTGEGTRTPNPAFGGRIQHAGGHPELFGYGKASLAAGLLAILRRRFLGEAVAEVDPTHPAAASQRDVVRVIEAATTVAERNHHYFEQGLGTPVTAAMDDDEVRILDPYEAVQLRDPDARSGAEA